MDYVKDGDYIIWQRELEGSRTYTLRASDIRNERTGVHARIAAVVRNETLAYTICNVDKDEERVRFANSIAKALIDKDKTLYPIVNLKHDLDNFCCGLWEQHIKNNSSHAVTISTTDPIAKPQYLIHPLVAKNQPNVLFGFGGSGKSTIALLLAITLQLPWTNNDLGFSLLDEQCQYTLYLDWETSPEEFGWRLQCLQRGLDLPVIELDYNRCYHPLAQEAESLSHYIKEHNIKCVVIDSLAAASGGDQKEAETALNFFQALRSLNTTSVVIAHTTKDTQFASGGKEIYGSVFYTNYARNIWHCKKFQEVGEDVLDVGLFHRKCNFSKLHAPLGYRLNFDEDEGVTTVRKISLEDSNLTTSLPLRLQIKNFLKRGAATLEEIAEGLEASEASIRVLLNRNKTMFTKIGNKWGSLERLYEE